MYHNQDLWKCDNIASIEGSFNRFPLSRLEHKTFIIQIKILRGDRKATQSKRFKVGRVQAYSILCALRNVWRESDID